MQLRPVRSLLEADGTHSEREGGEDRKDPHGRRVDHRARHVVHGEVAAHNSIGSDKDAA